MKYVNKTPHAIVLNDGQRFEPEGKPARVKARFSRTGCIGGISIFGQEFGEIENLPEKDEKDSETLIIIVSGLVLAAAKEQGRSDCVAPATGHPSVVRDENGRIVSVPGFVS